MLSSPAASPRGLPIGRRVRTDFQPRRGRSDTVKANVLSGTGALLCVIAGVALASGAPFWVAALLFPVGGVCDALDGFYARREREGTARLGAVIDSLCDKVGEAGLALGLFVAVQNNAARFALMVAYVLGTLTSYAKATAGEHGLRIVWHEARRFGRAGRVVILSLTLIVATLTGGSHEMSVFWGLVALAGFNLATFGWRVGRILREAN